MFTLHINQAPQHAPHQSGILMKESTSTHSSWSAKITRNSFRLACWTGAWILTMAAATFGPQWLWDYAPIPTVLAVITNLGTGFGMIFAHRQYLRSLDEMQQKIFLDAGSFSLGVGLVCGLGYEMLEDIKLITFQPEISHLVMLMTLAFAVAMVFGHRQYR
jgi:hypothetical protein